MLTTWSTLFSPQVPCVARGFVMTLGRLLAIGVSLIAAIGTHSASAQFCDDRFPWTCQEPGAPINITPVPRRFDEAAPAQPGNVDPALGRQYCVLHGAVDGQRFAIPGIRLSDINPAYLRTAVIYPTHEPPGTIVIDPHNHFLYLVQGGGRALRYGLGVASAVLKATTKAIAAAIVQSS